MRYINERGIKIVKSFEGFSGEPYLYASNVWAVGYGFTTGRDDGPVSPDMKPISEVHAVDQLGCDVEASKTWVYRFVKMALTEHQFSL